MHDDPSRRAVLGFEGGGVGGGGGGVHWAEGLAEKAPRGWVAVNRIVRGADAVTWCDYMLE